MFTATWFCVFAECAVRLLLEMSNPEHMRAPVMGLVASIDQYGSFPAAFSRNPAVGLKWENRTTINYNTILCCVLEIGVRMPTVQGVNTCETRGVLSVSSPRIQQGLAAVAHSSREMRDVEPSDSQKKMKRRTWGFHVRKSPTRLPSTTGEARRTHTIGRLRGGKMENPDKHVKPAEDDSQYM